MFGTTQLRRPMNSPWCALQLLSATGIAGSQDTENRVWQNPLHSRCNWSGSKQSSQPRVESQGQAPNQPLNDDKPPSLTHFNFFCEMHSPCRVSVIINKTMT